LHPVDGTLDHGIEALHAEACPVDAAIGHRIDHLTGQRARVDFDGDLPQGTIVIKTAEHRLYYTLGDGKAVRYAIADETVFALCELVCGGLRAQLAELDEILAAGVA